MSAARSRSRPAGAGCLAGLGPGPGLALALALALALWLGGMTASAQPAGTPPPAVTEAQAATTLSVLQRAMLYNDREAVARLVAFPLPVRLAGGVVEVADAAAFVRDYSTYVTPAVRRAVLSQSPQALVRSERGVRIGRGEVWLAGRCQPPGCSATVLRIVALNPVAEAGTAAPQTAPVEAPGAPGAPAADAAAGPGVGAGVPPVPPPLPAAAAAPPGSPAPQADASSAVPPATPPATVAAPAAAPSISARAAEVQAAFVNRVWQVRRSNAVAPGTLYSFLSEGTLLIASPQGMPTLGRWRLDGDRLVLLETGRPSAVDILVLRADRFGIRVRGLGEPVEIEFEPAAR